jgi:hypothetical protein
MFMKSDRHHGNRLRVVNSGLLCQGKVVDSMELQRMYKSLIMALAFIFPRVILAKQIPAHSACRQSSRRKEPYESSPV